MYIFYIKELESCIESLKVEKSDIHNESIHVAEQSQQRQQKIRQLEAVRCFS